MMHNCSMGPVCCRSLEKAWKEVKTDTLKISQTHDTAGADFDKLAQEMSSFTEEQKRQSKAVSHSPPLVYTQFLKLMTE